MTARPIFKGEARVLGWSHSNSTPFAVRLQLHRDDIPGEAHPFDGLQGQTVTVLIGQVDETPPSGDGPAEAAPSPQPRGRQTSRPWYTLTRSQQAGIRCRDKAFREWLVGKGCTVERAELEVRKTCGVASRADLSFSLRTGQSPDPEAIKRWDELDAAYRQAAGIDPEIRG